MGNREEGLKKYDTDGPFNDPVVRCDGCNKLVNKVDGAIKIGGCPHCGNKRVNAAMTFNKEELEKMKEWNIDPDFIAIFERVEDVVT